MKKLMTLLLTIMMMFSLVSVVSADDEKTTSTDEVPTFSLEEGDYDHNISVTITWPENNEGENHEGGWYIYGYQINDEQQQGGGDSSNVQTFDFTGKVGETTKIVLDAFYGSGGSTTKVSKTYTITLAETSGNVDDSSKNNIGDVDNENFNKDDITNVEVVIDSNVTVDDTSKSTIEEKVKEISSTGSVAKYLDINIKATDSSGNTANVTTFTQEESVHIRLDEDIKATVKGKNIKVVRLHNGVAEEIASVYNEETGVLTISSSAFSTYAIVVEDKTTSDNTTNTDGNTNSSDNTSNTTTGNVPCEVSGRVWSEKAQMCVYAVTNTSVR